MQTLGIALSAVEDGIRSWWCQVLDLRGRCGPSPLSTNGSKRRPQEIHSNHTDTLPQSFYCCSDAL